MNLRQEPRSGVVYLFGLFDCDNKILLESKRRLRLGCVKLRIAVLQKPTVPSPLIVLGAGADTRHRLEDHVTLSSSELDRELGLLIEPRIECVTVNALGRTSDGNGNASGNVIDQFVSVDLAELAAAADLS
jgi:hypothetical protein